MIRSLFGWLGLLGIAIVWAGSSVSVIAQDAPTTDDSRPNVVWIMSEDNSKHYLKHFDPEGAPAPNIEALASHGITFDRCFSNAPVCSVARTTLITGCYAPRIGTQFHRKLTIASLPNGYAMFPQLLRENGYHTSNRKKEDYNAIKSPEVWDASGAKASYIDRETGQPFFHVRTFTDSHESRLHFDDQWADRPTQTDPQTVAIQPYFPDTELFRYTRALYHDRMSLIDQKVGEVIEELVAADLLESTFVFYFGDHGGVLPRSKGYLYESGLHVPLVVRVPDRFADDIDAEMGDRIGDDDGGFVDFVDFGPTVLNLAGVEVPDWMDGEPFLGPGASPNLNGPQSDRTLGYADRMDEKYDLNRSLRIGSLKYIRHFEPHYPDSLINAYRYRMLAYRQWRDLYRDGDLGTEPSQFFEPRSPESLFDVSVDPHEVNNLADDPAYRGDLLRMRNELNRSLKSMPDLSFVTETFLAESAMNDPVAFGNEHAGAINRYIDTANLCLAPFESAEPLIRAALGDDDPIVRHWAIVAALSVGPDAEPLVNDIQKLMLDVEPIVVARAAEFVAMVAASRGLSDSDFSRMSPHPAASAGELSDPRPYLYRTLNRSISQPEALVALRAATYVRDHAGMKLDLDDSRCDLGVLKPQPKSEAAKYRTWLSETNASDKSTD